MLAQQRTASAVTISGEVNPIAEAVASGTWPIAKTNSMLPISISGRAGNLHQRSPRRDQPPPVLRQEHEQHHDQMAGKARPDDLYHRVARVSSFIDRVHQREQRDAGAHQQDAAQYGWV